MGEAPIPITSTAAYSHPSSGPLFLKNMDSKASERAEHRRRTWASGLIPATKDPMAADLEFWRTATGSDRLSATLQMAIDSWVIKGKRGAVPRLQGSPSGVRRR